VRKRRCKISHQGEGKVDESKGEGRNMERSPVKGEGRKKSKGEKASLSEFFIFLRFLSFFAFTL